MVAPFAAPVAPASVDADDTPLAAPAAAPMVAPAVTVPPPAFPPRSGGSPEWPKCDFFSGNASHSLLGIMAGEWTRKFGPANFDLILQKVDAPTMEILREFDLSKPGHTLMVPLNEGKNFTDNKLRDVNTFMQYGIVPSTMSTETATQIVRNHLVNETITYSDLQSITELGGTARYQSLGHAVWEFTNQGGIKLVDTYNLGQGRTKGVLFIQADITNAKQGECPNAVFSLDGVIITPQSVPPPPPPVPPAEPAPPPAPLIRTVPDNPFDSPAPPALTSPAPPAAEQAVADDSGSTRASAWSGAAAALGPLLSATALFVV